MTDVHTEHYREDGEQVTVRSVAITDAAGREFTHEFEVRGDYEDPEAHEYRGDGDPPDSAVEALEEFLGGEENE